MHTRCTSCYQWILLPAHYPMRQPLRVHCEGCGMALAPTAYSSRYDLCRICGHHYLAEYSICPICPAPGDLHATLAWQAEHLSMAALPPVMPLSDQYCT